MRAGALYTQTQAISADSRKLLERYVSGDGVIVGWGVSREGELGTGAQYNLLTPFMIGGHDKPVRMACSGLSSTWIGMRNVVMTMGSGMWGELAVGNPRFSPRVIVNDMNIPICTGQVEVASFVGKTEDVMIDVTGGFSYFTCISQNGTLYAWGANNYAQCHPHFTQNACCGYAQPRRIPGEKVVQVACANFAVLARTLSGAVYGWGVSFLLGDEGELVEELGKAGSALAEVPNVENRVVATVPVRIRFFDEEDIVLVRGGPWHFAAVTRKGDVYTWGLGNNGRLGHGDDDDQVVPKLVSALQGKKVIEVGCGSFHTVFVTESGEAYACGDNQGGQCGVRGEEWVGKPVRLHVTGSRRVTHSSCGRHHTILLLESGEVVAYGTGPGLGIGVGYGIRMVHCQPVMENYTSIWTESGPSHNFALTIPKTTCMFVLGVPHRGVPAAISSIGLKEGILSCGVGAGFTLMISRNGSCYSFGVGGWGQLGLDTTQAKDFTPERVPVIPHAMRISYFVRTIITYVAAGFSFGMAITEGERVFAWGNNSYGQCGLGVDPKRYQRIAQPREITWLADKEIVQVACGSYFALALSSSGDVYSWGTIECCGHGLEPSEEAVPPHLIRRNMGKESRGVILTPTKVLGLECIIQVAAGGWHALALNAIGDIFAWGIGSGGRLGLGSGTEFSYVPVRINTSTPFTRIGCGCYTSFAIDDDSNLYLWGVNDKNQLGVSGKVNEPTLAMENVRDVCLGKYYTLVLSHTGTFHLAGTMEHDHGSYVSSSFDDVDSLPEALKPSSLERERCTGIRVYGGFEHTVVLLERDRLSSEVISDVTTGLRFIPEEIVGRATQ